MFHPLKEWPPVSRFLPDIRKLYGKPVLGLDLEWDEITSKPTILGLSDGETTVSVPFEAGLPYLREILARNPATEFVGHSFVSADKVVLDELGINIPLQQIDDTIIWHYLVNAHLCKAVKKTEEGEGAKRGRGFMNLGSMCSIYTDLPYWKECRGAACETSFPSIPCPKHEPYLYNGTDALGPLLALPSLKKTARLRGVEHLYPLHRELSHVLAEMSRFGVMVDVPYVESLREEFQKEKTALAGTLPFNAESPKQVIEFFKKAGIKLENTQEQTIRDAVEELSEEAPVELLSLLDYKELGDGPDRWFAPRRLNEKNEWVGFVDERGFVHPRLGPYTSSGRLNCVDPNFQNVGKRRVDRKTGEKVGKKIRRAVIAPPGYYICRGDFSNAENRVYLYLAGYPPPDASLDFHSWMTDNIGIDDTHPFALALGSARDAAKSVVHAADYSEGLQLLEPGALRRPKIQAEIAAGARVVFTHWTFEGKIITFTGINLANRAFGDASWKNRKNALEIQERYFGAFPKIRDLQKRITKQCETEKIVRPPHGYATLSYGHAADRIKAALAIYGSQPVAHISKLSLIDLHRKHKAGRALFATMQIHDELFCYVPDSVAPDQAGKWLAESMMLETPEMPGFKLPVEVSYGSNWRDQEKIKL